jgi:hypothetical protein
MWLKELCKRWMGRTSRRTRRRFAHRRSYVRPRLENLEDRTLLSGSVAGVTTSGGMTTLTSGGGATSFTANSGLFSPNNPTATGNAFIGVQNKSFSASVGGITNSSILGSWGLAAYLNMNVNKLGLDMGYTATGGNVTATYNQVSLQQGYTPPTGFDQEVDITPTNTNVSYGSGGLNTTGPSFSAYTNFDLNIGGNVGGTAALGGAVSGSAPFNVNVSPSLFTLGIGPNGGGQIALTNLGIFGVNLLDAMNQSAAGGSVTQTVALSAPSYPLASFNAQVDEAPPVFVGGEVDANSSPVGISADLNLGLGEVGDEAVPGKFASLAPQVTTNLGSLAVGIPDIQLGSQSLQSGGVVSATGSGDIADLNIQAGPLVASLFGLPELAALTSSDEIDIGPVTLDVTPISFTIGPDLSIQQTGTITPVSTLTYSFSTPVDVIKNGTDQGVVSSVTFTPGQDSVGIGFTDQKITVTPTWNFGLNYTNELDLDASLNGNLTVGALSGSVGPYTVNLGPLYTQSFNFATYKLATISDTTFSMYSTSQQLASFTLGNNLPTSLVVTLQSDGTDVYNSPPGNPGQLRGAVASANFDGSTAQQVITLGAGTYTLTLTGSGYGSLVINPNVNLVIQGAGAGLMPIP